jgi:hypothetical protein
MRLDGWFRLWVGISGLWIALVVVVGLPEAWRTASRVPARDIYARMARPSVGVPLDFHAVLGESMEAWPAIGDTEENRLQRILRAADVPQEVRADAWDGYYRAKGGGELNDLLVRLRLPAKARFEVLSMAADYRGRAFKQRRLVGGDVLWFTYGLSESELADVCNEYSRVKRGALMRRGLEASGALIAVAAGPPLLLYAFGWIFVWARRRLRAGR